MVDVAQLVESRIVAPVVAGSSPVIHPFTDYADVAELVDALDLGSSGNTVQVRVLSPVPCRVVIRGMDISYNYSML